MALLQLGEMYEHFQDHGQHQRFSVGHQIYDYFIFVVAFLALNCLRQSVTDSQMWKFADWFSINTFGWTEQAI